MSATSWGWSDNRHPGQVPFLSAATASPLRVVRRYSYVWWWPGARRSVSAFDSADARSTSASIACCSACRGPRPAAAARQLLLLFPDRLLDRLGPVHQFEQPLLDRPLLLLGQFDFEQVRLVFLVGLEVPGARAGVVCPLLPPPVVLLFLAAGA